jgi:hypothetical protein
VYTVRCAAERLPCLNEDSAKNKSFRPVYRPPMPPSSTTVSTGRKALPFPTAKAIFWITFWFWISTSISFMGMQLLEWGKEAHDNRDVSKVIFNDLAGIVVGIVLCAFLGVIVVTPLVLLVKNRPFWWKESITCTLVTLTIALIFGVPFIQDYRTFDQRQEDFMKNAKKYGYIPVGHSKKPDLVEGITKLALMSLGVGMTTGAMASRFYRANHPSQMAPEA